MTAPTTERNRQLTELRRTAPLRAPAGRVIQRQHNTDALPLFGAAAEPRLL